MLEEYDINKIYRIIDANLNRSKEGLRVIEEYIRFYIEDDVLLKEIRKSRHYLGSISQGIYSIILPQRDTQNDSGSILKEESRQDLISLVTANFKRVEESLRVLEEFLKLSDFVSTKINHAELKQLRFNIYNLEKKVLVGKI